MLFDRDLTFSLSFSSVTLNSLIKFLAVFSPKLSANFATSVISCLTLLPIFIFLKDLFIPEIFLFRSSRTLLTSLNDNRTFLAPESFMFPKDLLNSLIFDLISEISEESVSNCLKSPVPLPRLVSILSSFEIALSSVFVSIPSSIVRGSFVILSMLLSADFN